MDTSDPKSSTTDILSTEQSALNLSITTPTTINLANISIFDDETIPTEESTNSSAQQQRKQTDETTTTDDDDDEQTQLKRLKSANEQIEAHEEDEDEEQPDEVKLTEKRKFYLHLFLGRGRI
jgi:hypothetical protein